MSKNITFIATSKYYEELCSDEKPYPASKLLPKWWKDSTPYLKNASNPDGTKIILEDWESNATFKKCTPMLDSLTSGYIIPLWSDVLVRKGEVYPEISWRVRSQPVFEFHGESSLNMESPEGYYERALKYNNHWHIKTPPGYSVLITTPFAYPNNPVKQITAVIDTDKSRHPITLPVWLKKDFDGVLEKGTPIAQVIPFKRDNWEATFDSYEENELNLYVEKDSKLTLVNNYVKNIWQKKSYK
jgi:hypothetical protein